jgi:hypothetical protein
VISLDTILPTAGFSVYEFEIARHDLVPTPEDAVNFIREVEARYPDPDALEREVARWWEV